MLPTSASRGGRGQKAESFRVGKHYGGSFQGAARPSGPETVLNLGQPQDLRTNRAGAQGAPGGPVGADRWVGAGDRSGQRRPFRRRLYALQQAFREHSANPRVGKCARVRVMLDAIQIRGGGSNAAFSGLLKCRTKSCPVCLARRRSEAAELVSGVVRQLAPDTQPYLATFTVRHGSRDSLERTGHGIRACWRKLISGRAWQHIRKELGLEYIVSEEVTWGAENGWHPHLHVLFFPSRPLDIDTLWLADVLFERWASIVERELGPQYAPLPGPGVDFRPCAGERYIAKLGLELSDPGTKRGRDGKGRTPLQILEDWAANRNAEDLELYREWEAALKGRRDLTWSKGLRAARQLAAERLKEARSEQPQDVIAELPGPVWDRLRDRAGFIPELLDAAERDGLEGVLGVIDEHGSSAHVWEVRRRSDAARARPPPCQA